MVLIWLLASRNSNKLPYDNEWIKQRIGVSADVDLDELALAGFIHIDKEKLEQIQEDKVNASKVVATCNQSADTEERESRGEREGEQSRGRAEITSTSSPDVVLIFDYWKTVFNEKDCRLTSGRSSKIKARLKDGYTVDQIKLAIDGCSMSDHHMGKNDNGKIYNCLTLICRSAEKLEQFIGYTKKNNVFDKRAQEVDDWVSGTDSQYSGGITIDQGGF